MQQINTLGGGYNVLVVNDKNKNLVNLSDKFFQSELELREYLDINGYEIFPGIPVTEKKAKTIRIIIEIPDDEGLQLIEKYKVNELDVTESKVASAQERNIERKRTRTTDGVQIADRVADLLKRDKITTGPRGGLINLETKSGITESERKYFKKYYGLDVEDAYRRNLINDLILNKKVD